VRDAAPHEISMVMKGARKEAYCTLIKEITATPWWPMTWRQGVSRLMAGAPESCAHFED